jgi:hypothetical protein
LAAGHFHKELVAIETHQAAKGVGALWWFVAVKR